MFESKIDNKTEMMAKIKEVITRGMIFSSKNPMVLFNSKITFSILSLISEGIGSKSNSSAKNYHFATSYLMLMSDST
jgi:hypothetical protein